MRHYHNHTYIHTYTPSSLDDSWSFHQQTIVNASVRPVEQCSTCHSTTYIHRVGGVWEIIIDTSSSMVAIIFTTNPLDISTLQELNREESEKYGWTKLAHPKGFTLFCGEREREREEARRTMSFFLFLLASLLNVWSSDWTRKELTAFMCDYTYKRFFTLAIYPFILVQAKERLEERCKSVVTWPTT